MMPYFLEGKARDSYESCTNDEKMNADVILNKLEERFVVCVDEMRHTIDIKIGVLEPLEEYIIRFDKISSELKLDKKEIVSLFILGLTDRLRGKMIADFDSWKMEKVREKVPVNICRIFG